MKKEVKNLSLLQNDLENNINLHIIHFYIKKMKLRMKSCSKKDFTWFYPHPKTGMHTPCLSTKFAEEEYRSLSLTLSLLPDADKYLT